MQLQIHHIDVYGIEALTGCGIHISICLVSFLANRLIQIVVSF